MKLCPKESLSDLAISAPIYYKNQYKDNTFNINLVKPEASICKGKERKI